MFLGHKTPSAGSTTSYPAIAGDATPTPGSSSGPSVVTSPGSAAPAAPTPTPGKASPATMTFTGLGLDASNDAKGAPRTFTFTSDGNGPVTFAVTKISSGGTAKLCISVDDGAFACKIGPPSKLPHEQGGPDPAQVDDDAGRLQQFRADCGCHVHLAGRRTQGHPHARPLPGNAGRAQRLHRHLPAQSCGPPQRADGLDPSHNGRERDALRRHGPAGRQPGHQVLQGCRVPEPDLHRPNGPGQEIPDQDAAHFTR